MKRPGRAPTAHISQRNFTRTVRFAAFEPPAARNSGWRLQKSCAQVQDFPYSLFTLHYSFTLSLLPSLRAGLLEIRSIRITVQIIRVRRMAPVTADIRFCRRKETALANTVSTVILFSRQTGICRYLFPMPRLPSPKCRQRSESTRQAPFCLTVL